MSLNPLEQILDLIQKGQLDLADSQVKTLVSTNPSAGAFNLAGHLALQQNQEQAALLAFKQAFQAEPDDAEHAYNYLNILLRNKLHSEAHTLCLALKPDKADSDLSAFVTKFLIQGSDPAQAFPWFCRLDRLSAEQARACFAFGLRSIAQWPAICLQKLKPELAWFAYWEQLAWHFVESQTDLEAAQAWEVITKLSDHASYWNNLGCARFGLQAYSLAQQAFETAIEMDPLLLDAHYHLALLALERSEFALAQKHLDLCFQKPEQFAERLYLYGCHYLDSRRFKAADLCLHMCLPYRSLLSVSEDSLYRNLALVQHELYESEKMVRYLGLAQAKATPYRHVLQSLFSLPYIYQNSQEIIAARQRVSFGLQKLVDRLRNSQQRQGAKLIELDMHPSFQLAYQGLNDRSIMELFAEIIHLSQSTPFDQALPLKKRSQIRVGFVSTFFYNHSVLKAYEGIIKKFGESERFETAVFHLNQHSDASTQQLRQTVKHFSQTLRLDQTRQAIQEFDADVLIYTDIGMSANTYLLAAQRLAPIQCVMSGHPVTTGLKTIDYYLSNKLAEPEDAHDHYSENLFLMPYGGTIYQPFQPPLALGKAHLGWCDNKHIYFCPMTLFKIHPSFDFAIEEILARDDQAEIWFVKDSQSAYHEMLSKRFEINLPDYASRIHFMDWMSALDFQQAIQAADVVLDSFCFGAGTTNRMVLGLGQPMVTLPGEFVRGRYCLSVYRRLGLEDWVADSPQTYVEQALQLGNDRDWRAERRSQLLDRKALMFEKSETSYTLLDFVQEAVSVFPASLKQPLKSLS